MLIKYDVFEVTFCYFFFGIFKRSFISGTIEYNESIRCPQRNMSSVWLIYFAFKIDYIYWSHKLLVVLWRRYLRKMYNLLGHILFLNRHRSRVVAFWSVKSLTVQL